MKTILIITLSLGFLGAANADVPRGFQLLDEQVVEGTIELGKGQVDCEGNGGSHFGNGYGNSSSYYLKLKNLNADPLLDRLTLSSRIYNRRACSRHEKSVEQRPGVLDFHFVVQTLAQDHHRGYCVIYNRLAPGSHAQLSLSSGNVYYENRSLFYSRRSFEGPCSNLIGE